MGNSEEVGLTTSLLLFIVIVMLLLAVAIVVFFLVYQKRLFQQQKQIRDIETSQQRRLMQAVVSAQEEERRHLASELHDGIGSLISAGKLYLKKIESSTSLQASRPLLSEAGNILDESMRTMRELSSNLSPASLQRYGLVAALEDLCQRVAKLDTHTIVFQSHGEEVRLSDETESSLFRIAQELINNTLKHAKAKNISLSVRFLPDHLQFLYNDDGQGFDLKAPQPGSSKSFGLINIESRAQLMDAQLVLDSSPGEGMNLLLVVPNPPPNDAD